MRYHLVLLVFLGTTVASQAAESHEKCTCPCEKRFTVDSRKKHCIQLKSVKSKGYVTADKNHMFTPNERRYTYVATDRNQYTKWKLYTNSAWGTNNYAMRSIPLNEFIYGTPTATRSTYSRFVLTWRKDIQVIPREGFWQFIPAGNNQYMLRNTWSGEYLYVANEDHSQVKGSKRLYTYRHINSKPTKTEGANAALFEIVFC